jgi:hypothetical protein
MMISGSTEPDNYGSADNNPFLSFPWVHKTPDL